MLRLAYVEMCGESLGILNTKDGYLLNICL